MPRILLYGWIAIAALSVAILPQNVQAHEPGQGHSHPHTLTLSQDRLNEAGREAEYYNPKPPFSEGTWTVEPLVFAVTDVSRRGHTDIYGGALGTSYYFADDLAIRLEAIGLSSKQTNDNAHGGGLNLHGRWHFLRGDLFTLFFEGGGGLLYTNNSLPDDDRANNKDGTNFNFTATAIVGTTIQLAPDLHLNTAFRYVHISNARRHGAKRNPTTEAIGGHVGLIWTF